MCGIAGIISFDYQPEKKILSAMLSKIKYRGPDQTGSFVAKAAAIGIQRLSIIDLATGRQPIENEDGSIVVVFNGEIYNFQDLTRELKEKGHIFKTKSDTEVLVHLYEQYGPSMAKKLNGMFAFAVWDKGKEQLFLARDPVGIKPLYYYHKGKTLIFGSEIKSILAHPLVKKRINPDALNAYSYSGYIGGESSIFLDINKLLPGQALIFNKKGKKKINFYEIPNRVSSASLEDILKKSIISQSVADVPLGVLLSGGIDSSLVAYYLTKAAGKKIHSFSIGFEEKSFDETKFAKIVSLRLNTNHHQEIFKASDVIDSFDEILKKMDEPLADPSLFPAYKLCRLTKKYVKVALSGDGGDELFGGYPTYQGHMLASKVKGLLPASLVKVAVKFLGLIGSSYENYPKTEIIKNFLGGLNKPDLERHLAWMSLGTSSDLLNKDILTKDINYSKSKYQSQLEEKISKREDNIKFQLLDFYTYLADDLLVKTDRASMFNSLEVRVPLLDLSVLEFAFNTKNKHVSFFETKKILRALAKEKFPKEITDRKKKGFGIPLARWINGDLASFIYGKLENKRLYDFFDKKAVYNLWENHKKGRQNNAKTIWMLAIFSGWLNYWYKN